MSSLNLRLLLPLISLMLLLAGCTTPSPYLADAPSLTPVSALPGNSTTLGQRYSEISNGHAGQSGFLLLDKGEESLLWRGALTDRAEQSIDIQTFIWNDDNVGIIAAERVLRAADRGVRVRVLIDDITLTVQQRFLALLDRHPNLEIRLYNPLARRDASAIDKLDSLLSNWALKHRRMHNKLFVIDNSVAITGGRNIANEYYDMSEPYNYRDRDLLAIGDLVPELSNLFDLYWNSRWSVPLSRLIDSGSATDYLLPQAFYAELAAYVADPANLPPRFDKQLEMLGKRAETLERQVVWADATLVFDLPGKNPELSNMQGYGASGEALTEAAARSQREILVETPYLIPPKGGMQLLSELAGRGVTIKILTNSFASTDNAPAFSGYLRRRPALLSAGIELYELRPDPEIESVLVERLPYMTRDAIFSLHAKTAVFDRERLFVGSFNFDPRSTNLNTEMGILIDSSELAQQVAEIILTDMAPVNSWQVTADAAGGLSWRTMRGEGGEQVLNHEPDTSIGDFFTMLFLSLLPLDTIL